MASPEMSGNFGERNGKRIRNVGVVVAAAGVVAPPLFVPGVGLAISGEVLSRVSKKKK
jgi:hypothetical protein